MQIELLVPLLIAGVAYFTGSLDLTGSITGGVMGYMILFTQGFEGLLVLLVFFTASAMATKYKYSKKSRYGLSQKRRAVENVLGNGLVPLYFAVFGGIVPFCAALAAATADTLSSEIGVLSRKKPVSILDFETEVPRGANGGVSTLGNAMAFLGAGIIAVVCLLLFQSWIVFWTALWGGVFGCLVDSVLGATLEKEGILGNHLVNLLATLSAALFGIGLTLVL